MNKISETGLGKVFYATNGIMTASVPVIVPMTAYSEQEYIRNYTPQELADFVRKDKDANVISKESVTTYRVDSGLNHKDLKFQISYIEYNDIPPAGVSKGDEVVYEVSIIEYKLSEETQNIKKIITTKHTFMDQLKGKEGHTPYVGLRFQSFGPYSKYPPGQVHEWVATKKLNDKVISDKQNKFRDIAAHIMELRTQK